MKKRKLYCFVDETGQDTEGRFFLVALILTESEIKEGIERKLEEIEVKTKKEKIKWTKSPFKNRKQYLTDVAHIQGMRDSLYYSIYNETKTYTQLTALTIAKAVLAKGESNYSVTIIIDGLTKKDTEKIRSELKKLRVKYDTIRGMKDEQSAYLRLADSFAGFLRDYIEKQTYTGDLFTLLKNKGIIIEA
ncbi:MAG: DUF3800 domain-containing protein [Candidatus Levyibacteriota bacterium]